MAKCYLVIIVNVYVVVSCVFVYITGENVICPTNCLCTPLYKATPYTNKLKVKCGSNFSVTNITELQFNVFQNLKDIINLDLSANNITLLKRKSFPLQELQKLDLSTNSIDWIEDGTFGNLGALKRLDLSNNRIKFITAGMLEGLHNLEKLKLSQNLIRQLKEGTFDGLPSLKQLDISSNPLLCDCEFWWIGVWSANMSVKLSPSAKCFEPIALRDQSIRKLKTLGQHCSWAEYSQISPLQLTPDNDQVVFEGDSLKLECRAVDALRVLAAAVSPPEVSLSWYWAGLAPSSVFPNSVRIDNKTPTDSGMLQSTLVIDQLHSNHTGEWNCELVSSELNHTNTLSVIVISGRTSYCPPIVTKSNKGQYNWPKTVAGHIVDLPCAAEVALGTARYNCTLNATWTDLDTAACPYISETTRILQQYAKMNLSQSNKSSILESVKRLHNYTLGHKLSFKDHMDIVFITETITNYLEFVSSEKEIGTILLDLVSHLMDLDEHLLATAQLQDKSCRKLIQAVEIIAEYSHMSHPYRGWNLAVETFRVTRENFLGLTCTWWTGKDRKRDKLFQCSNNKSTVLLTHEKMVEASIQIPESLFRQLEQRGRSFATIQIFFAIYDNGKLFPAINESISSLTSPIVGAKIGKVRKILSYRPKTAVAEQVNRFD